MLAIWEPRSGSPHALHAGTKEFHMTTILIIVLLVILVGGGGFYGRGRWF